MERVAFLVEATGQRLGCLLNPESLLMRRTAGVRPRRAAVGLLTGQGLADDPLLYTGGGTTELELDLLFDVALAGSSIVTDDVRELTRPLWELAENQAGDDGYGRPRLARFVWGKAWNMPGVVAAVAERLEQFTPAGAPRRSWLRLRLLRVSEPAPPPPAARPLPQALALPPEALPVAPDAVRVHDIIGSGVTEGEGGATERLDQIAARYCGQPWYWRLLAAFNNIDDPLRLAAGQQLRIPPVGGPGGQP
jgi:hypothetical protein